MGIWWFGTIGLGHLQDGFSPVMYVGLLTPLTIVISTINNLVGGLEHHFCFSIQLGIS